MNKTITNLLARAAAVLAAVVAADCAGARADRARCGAG